MISESERVKEWAALDAKGEASPEVSTWLRGDGVEQWCDALTALVMQVDADCAKRKATVSDAKAAGWAPHVQRQAQADYDRWKKGALIFKRHIVAKLAEAKRFRHEKAQRLNYEQYSIQPLLVDLADFVDDLLERNALSGADAARGEALLDQVPDWLDTAPAVLHALAMRS